MQVEFTIAGVPQKLEAKSVPFAVVSENWNEYQTEDGRTVRVKLVLTRVVVPVDNHYWLPLQQSYRRAVRIKLGLEEKA